MKLLYNKKIKGKAIAIPNTAHPMYGGSKMKISCIFPKFKTLKINMGNFNKKTREYKVEFHNLGKLPVIELDNVFYFIWDKNGEVFLEKCENQQKEKLLHPPEIVIA